MPENLDENSLVSLSGIRTICFVVLENSFLCAVDLYLGDVCKNVLLKPNLVFSFMCVYLHVNFLSTVAQDIFENPFQCRLVREVGIHWLLH